jgi:Flp pilus assembly pilin Flp
MKTYMKRLLRDEKGASLVMVLILLLISGLIIGPLLSYMGTGLITGEIYERRTDELYAADAGVEDAIWSISHRLIPLGSWQESNEQPGWWVYEYPEPLIVNGKSVDLTVYRKDLDPTCGEELVYRILATAVTDDDGNTAAIDSATTVEAYVLALSMNFTALLDHAIVSYNTIGVKPGDVVNGDVWLPDEDDLSIQPSSSEPEAVINGTVKDKGDMIITWPTYEQLSTYYYEDVEGTDDPGPSIDIEDTNTIGACYRDGDLVIDNTGDPDTLVLDGTVYVAGDLKFLQSGSHGYTIDLNGHTIFAEGGIYFPSHRVSISGSGCIIAGGDIIFHPGITSGGDDFVLVMSIAGIVDFQPSGDFTGCVAGNVDVQLQPNCTINWIDPEGKGLDFPGIGGGDELPLVSEVSIYSWEVIPLSPDDFSE